MFGNRFQAACWLATLLAGLVFVGQAQAQNYNSVLMSKDFTQGDWALLPDYCIDTQAGPFGGPEGGSGLNRSPRAAHWVNLMGIDFWNMHHYCYALRDIRRANDDARAGPRDRVALYERALSDLGYVVNNSRPTMALMPEVMLKVGEVHVKLGNLPAAQAAFESARELKRDYWPAYTRWIDVLLQLKRTASARALAEEGLRYAPDSPELRQRAAALGVRMAAQTPKTASDSSTASEQVNKQ